MVKRIRSPKARDAADSQAPEPGPEVVSEGTGASPAPVRPAFLRELPADPELERLAAAYERGDFAEVRTGAPALASSTSDPRVRALALELRMRIEPHPQVVRLVVVGALLVLGAILWTYWGGGAR